MICEATLSYAGVVVLFGILIEFNLVSSLHVILTANAAWNALNFRRAILEMLLADKHRVTILAPFDESVPKLEALGCRFIHLDMNLTSLNPLQGFGLRRQFIRVFRQERPDIVLSYTIKNNIFGALAAKSYGVPFIPNVSGLGTAFLSGHVVANSVSRLNRWAFAPLPVVFFQNSEDRDAFLAKRIVREAQTQILPGSGIDLRRFAPTSDPPSGDLVFLMIARLLRDKGVQEFADAARIVRRAVPRARFQLIGATNAANRTAITAETVQAWQDEGILDYIGEVDDVRPYITSAHCVVLPSYREGAPRTLLEASAMARPVIATDVPGCRAVVDRDKTGLLCQVRSAESLAEACQSFLDMPLEARHQMGLLGRKKMEAEFDQALVITAYREAIQTLTGTS